MSRLGVKDAAFEEVEDVLNELAHLRERWDNRFTVNNLTLAERYLEHKLNIVFEWIPAEWGGKHLRAVLQRELMIGGPQADRKGGQALGSIGELLPERSHSIDLNGAMAGAYRYDRLVFVEDVQLVDAPQGFVPTLVRFQVVEKRPRLAAGPLYRFAGAGFKHVFGLPEREFNVVVTRPGGVAEANDLNRKEVEGRAHIVNGVANDGAPIGRDARSYGHLPDALASCMIVLGQDDIWLSGKERLDLFGKLPDVALGPFDL